MRELLLLEFRQWLSGMDPQKVLPALLLVVVQYSWIPLCTACAVAAGLALHQGDAGEFLRWLVFAAMADLMGPKVVGLLRMRVEPPPPPPPE